MFEVLFLGCLIYLIYNHYDKNTFGEERGLEDIIADFIKKLK